MEKGGGILVHSPPPGPSLPGSRLPHLPPLVGHGGAVAGVAGQGERGAGSSPVRLPRDRLQGPGQTRVGAGRLRVGDHVREALVVWRVVARAGALQAPGARAQDVGGLGGGVGLRGGGSVGEEVVGAPWAVVVALVLCGGEERSVRGDPLSRTISRCVFIHTYVSHIWSSLSKTRRKIKYSCYLL